MLQNISLLTALVLFASGASRQWVSLGSHELETGATVYGLVTDEADTIVFAGISVENTDWNFLTEEEIYQFNGSGAVFRDDIMSRVCCDGSETVVSILDVSL